MIAIRVENFSCIKSAELIVGDFTILIGPQASGKSILSKLIYFFTDQISKQYDRVVEQKPFEAFSDDIKSRFAEWFPVAAWGKDKFKIEFEMGEYKVRLTRTSYDDSVRDNLRIWTSGLVKQHYKHSSDLIKKLRQSTAKKVRSEFADIELSWSLRDSASKQLSMEVGKDYVEYQTFIPAGRSFFTTLGRAFMAFEGRAMDPITIQFGRYFTAMQDDARWRRSRRLSGLDAELGTVLGGTVIWKDETPSLRCSDGRVMPFSALSSGQQELLPLVTALSRFGGRNTRAQEFSHLLYIEEPEAHLFPNSQSQLLKVLAALVNQNNKNRRLVITTHSPYVLATANNLIKAGSLANTLSASKREILDKIVDPAHQLERGTVRAYAIIDGYLKGIIDEDGLVAADYLDSISGEIGQQFSSLLELEFTE
ncbi:ATP-binding protein [Xanthomonas campestris pv. raphani]|uniref:AAA family ATPase n=1 Tax=Xanthomonas campestris TaxID=339 RepID=UPI001E51644A|nr:ATP-binding protein [Xanthomonas campestris]MCC5069113.1 ATP-binding protein [Xanthomonas campestris]MEA9786271.1 ATP-binding protein [Xanthomonas campestris pv. raphani]